MISSGVRLPSAHLPSAIYRVPIFPYTRNHNFKAVMASSLDIQTKYKLNSGYEIPVLGYGVSPSSSPFALIMHVLYDESCGMHQDNADTTVIF